MHTDPREAVRESMEVMRVLHTDPIEAVRESMEVMQVLHMNGGAGETSYATNSLLQRRVISLVRPVMDEAISDLYLSSFPSTLVIADLGCSSGPNAFFAVSQLIKTVENLRMQLGHDEAPEYQIFLNDLPGNDFNVIFRTLPRSEDMKAPCYFTGVPGTFHGRLFPRKSLHFVHSSYSLHWLSKVPEGVEGNKNICIATTSPQSAIDAYYKQFQSDFSVFLKSRAQELVSGGRMVLTMLGRRSEHPSSEERCCILELLGMALDEMVMEGLIEEGKLDSFNIPLYMPSPAELKTQVIKEGSFSINRPEISEVSWSGKRRTERCSNNGEYHPKEAYDVAMSMRAVTESMLLSHFGHGIIEEVFRRYKLLIEDRLAKEKTGYINLTISLARMAV